MNRDDLRDLYLDLLKRTITRSILPEQFERIPPNSKTLWRRLRWAAYNTINKILAPAKLALVHFQRYTGESMVGLSQFDRLQECILDVIRNDIPGDLLEGGVWRGGTSIFMRAVLKVYGDTQRVVWAADSFEGLPKPDVDKYPADAGSFFWKLTLGVSLEEVKQNFAKYNMLDDGVRFLQGFFSDTMPTAPFDKLSILRLDGDMYGSTMDLLVHGYPKLSVGGYVIVDDYGCVPECKQATEDYRRQHGITESIQVIDWTGVYWKKEKEVALACAAETRCLVTGHTAG